MEPLAHSAKPPKGIDSQSYRSHVERVVRGTIERCSKMDTYYSGDRGFLMEALRLAAEYHDLGKLDQSNQEVLRHHPRKSLPVNHVDAGVAHLAGSDTVRQLAALSVYSHHVGLPDIPDVFAGKEEDRFRDTDIRQRTDAHLEAYLASHRQALGYQRCPDEACGVKPNVAVSGLLFRLALSCLVDADHSDTAVHYRKESSNEVPLLMPDARLKSLDSYVAELGRGLADERTEIRRRVYADSREADTSCGMYACGSPVGTGKTTAVMAHLLNAACEKTLRRVFIVLPYTNIIDQSVETYRKSLTLPGEKPATVVAAHHHKADFADDAARLLTFQWRSPIIVVTAVRFFETLADKQPAALRKLHNLPGSAIFIDESHAALPWDLWPQAWKWLKELESTWGCHIVLGSGSLYRFWELPAFSDPPEHIPNLLPPELEITAARYEEKRVDYKSKEEPMRVDDLVEWVWNFPGPRLVIVNTVYSAAVIAEALKKRYGRNKVEHLSSSLCPAHVSATLKKVQDRLNDKTDYDWCLVATSCVEAGVNLSFRTGMRERASLVSSLQTAGRVNREGQWSSAEVWDFQLVEEGLVRSNPGLKNSREVLGYLIAEGEIGPEHATKAMAKELTLKDIKSRIDRITRAEERMRFPEVAKQFCVIDSDTVTAVVDKDVAARLDGGETVSPDELQASSVSIRRHLMDEYALEEIRNRGLARFRGYPEVFRWTLGYDEFIGYMKGVMDSYRHQTEGSITE